MATLSRTQQTLHLSDGRQLGFAEYGSPTGKPMFYFHGFPSSRLEAQPIDDIAQRCGIRLIALDRPGFGLSSPNPDYRIIDWPEDVAELAKARNITEFSVFGLSGGGPFALACAFALPKRTLTSVGLFASAPPWEAGPAIKRIGTWLDAQDAKEKPGIEITKSHAERVEDLVNMLLDEPFRQGASGTVHETKLLTSQDWGFKLEDVDYDNVQIWHGVKDTNAPIAMIRYMAEHIPNCELNEFEEDTHYTMYKHIEPALRSLMKAKENN
ncbi:hypothetical protein NXS19_004206 [Fusarium pseudograminearum]|nr:hypothetical protein NXS19_004206 [Fusarium pseudograminearum]